MLILEILPIDTYCVIWHRVPGDCILVYVPCMFLFVIFLIVWLLENGSLWTEKCWSRYNIDHWGVFLYTVLFVGWFIKGEMRTVVKVSKFQYLFVLTTPEQYFNVLSIIQVLDIFNDIIFKKRYVSKLGLFPSSGKNVGHKLLSQIQ